MVSANKIDSYPLRRACTPVKLIKLGIPSDNADNELEQRAAKSRRWARELAMTITVDGASYAVSKTTGSPVCVRVSAGDWKLFKRRKNETDVALQARIVSTLNGLREVRALAMLVHARC